MGASICQVNQLGGLVPLISLWYHIYLWVQIFCWTSCWILFFMCELKRKFLCMLLALGSVRMWKCHYPMQCSDLLSKTQPLYMRCFPCVTWLQRGAVSRQPGNKIIAPALMTCDEVDISWIFQPCASSCGADDLFGGRSGIVRYFNILSFNL